MPLSILAFLTKNYRAIFISAIIVLSLLATYNSGKRTVQDKWDAEKAVIAEQIAKNNADNAILGATILGGQYVWKNNLANELANSDRMSAASFSDLYSSKTPAGVNGVSANNRVPTKGNGSAEARDRSIKEAIAELQSINKERNYDTSEAKRNTLTLMDLQAFDKRRK